MLGPDELQACLRVLEALAEDRGLLAGLDEPTRRALLTAAGRLSRPDPAGRRKLHRAFRKKDRDEVRAKDAALVARTLNRQARRASGHVLTASTAPTTGRELPPADAPELHEPRSCYVCKQPFRKLHAFYDQLCPDCAELNFRKRHQTADLRGRTALVTGARIKIGFQAALMLLRAGAQVIATTRFPADAAARFAAEPDFDAFRSRLSIHGLDLRHVPSVEAFARHLETSLPALDLLINNAAQTVRRPPAFYRSLAEREERALHELPAAARALLGGDGQGGGLVHFQARQLSPAQLTQLQLTPEDVRDAQAFPEGQLDLDGQQVDLRAQNSWRLTADQVSTVELLEVHLVNAVAPFLLTSRLRALLKKRPGRDKHVVHVSAMEAQFARNKKTDRHPHTNMAKASLNMLTRTSAVDYERDGVFMNSVDTGWITDEDPLHHVARKQDEHDFHPPLDAIDGAARVLDPIFTGYLTGEHPWGHFFKDYRSVPW